MSERQAANPEDFTNRYEYSKSTSNYHFDDDTNPPFIKTGRYIGKLENILDELVAKTVN